jgi:hypothetical protein
MKNKKNIYEPEVPETSAKKSSAEIHFNNSSAYRDYRYLVVARQLEDIRKRNRG